MTQQKKKTKMIICDCGNPVKAVYEDHPEGDHWYYEFKCKCGVWRSTSDYIGKNSQKRKKKP